MEFQFRIDINGENVYTVTFKFLSFVGQKKIATAIDGLIFTFDIFKRYIVFS